MKVKVPTAASLVLALEDGPSDNLSPVFHQLRGLVLRKGCRVSVHLGFKRTNVIITKIEPSSKPDCLIDAKTYISVADDDKGNLASVIKPVQIPKVTVREVKEQLPGLESVFEDLEEVLIYPIFYRKLVDKLGIKCPKGVLLHGPPGCGKTMLVSTFCRQFSISLTVINGPEVFSSGFGESESKLGEIFKSASDTARTSANGCVLFIDEIDALAPPRDAMESQNHESRVVARLLTLMDGLDERSDRLVVIGATNRPNSVDIALRRPGRFDREISIDPPDAESRCNILQFASKDLKCDKSVDFNVLKTRTNGYVGADLVALCREAAMNALRNNVNSVSMSDFEVALKNTLPSLQRHQLAITRQNLDPTMHSWDNIGGMEDVKLKLKQMIEWPLLHPETFKRLGIQPARGLLLYGPPGCSKTTMVRITAASSGASFFSLDGASLFSPYFGESEKTVRELFARARKASPSIIFLDEIDSMVGNRSSSMADSSSVPTRVLSTLLNEMDGVEASVGNVLVIAATNKSPKALDSALVRAGRFDRTLYVGPPKDESEMIKVLQVHTRKLTLDSDVRVQDLARMLCGKGEGLYTGADVRGWCREAAMCALRQDLESSMVVCAFLV